MFKRYLRSKLSSDIGKTNLSNREAWLENALKQIPVGLSILDAGAGELQYKKFCNHLKYTSQDFAQYTGEGNEGLQTGSWDNSKLDIISDITAIPVPDASFDAVMCIEVLEHVPDPQKALSELTRILKNGGYLIVTAPFCSLTHFAPYHYSTGFSRYFYELLQDRFNIISLTPSGNYFEYIAQEIRRVPEIAKKYSGINLKRSDSIILRLMLKFLQKVNTNNDSSELLCFGYHFIAQKK